MEFICCDRSTNRLVVSSMKIYLFTCVYIIFLRLISAEYDESALYLQQNVKVNEYRLEITPFHEITSERLLNSNVMLFSGEVNISMSVDEQMNMLIIHAHENMHMGQILLLESNLELNYTRKNYQLWITHSFLENHTYSMQIMYTGFIESREMGFFSPMAHNNLTDLNGNLLEGTVLTTQCQPIYARMILPCIDQPDMKARFQLRLNHPSASQAISNTPILSSQPMMNLAGYHTTLFEKTPEMSTYLFAFSIGNFRSAEIVADDGMILRIFVDASSSINTTLLETIAEISKTAYESLRSYYSYPLPISKIDGIFVERLGAMENFGMISYSMEDLREGISMHSLDSITGKIWHEINHQWIGNIVTAKWWTDIWINEGITHFLQMKYTNVSGHWNLAISNLAVRQPVNNVDDYMNAFQTTYEIAGGIVKMLERILGEKDFRSMLQIFLRKYAFKSASLQNFINIIPKSEHSNHIHEFLHTFMDQKGLPRINIEYSNSTYIITQTNALEEFSQKKYNEHSPYKSLFTIPIFYSVNGTDHITWMKHNDESIILNFTKNHMIVFDEEYNGRYYITLNAESQEHLIAQKGCAAVKRTSCISNINPCMRCI